MRSVPSANVVVTIESAAGETSAAPRPCSARPPISMPDDVAMPLTSEATVKTATPGDEQALPAEQVGRAPAEQQEAAEDERVGVDDPLQARPARSARPVLDRRQRDVHDRRVEHDHELRDADEDEDEPAVDRGARNCTCLDDCLHETTSLP